MNSLKSRAARLSLGLIMMALLALVSSGVALADSTTGTAMVSAGTLTEANGTTPAPSVTLNGTDQTSSYNLAITTTDASGSGSGWNMTITSTTFATSGATHSFSASASSLTGVTAIAVGGSTSTNPTNAITYPLTVPAASIAPTPVKFFSAAANTGMGKFTITPTVTVSIPANTYAGSYTSIISLAVVSGP